jgi:phosphatidylserine decarboxylase
MRIRTPGGAEVIAIMQIAGLLARRMVCDMPVDDKLSISGSNGLIWFGSRLDDC